MKAEKKQTLGLTREEWRTIVIALRRMPRQNVEYHQLADRMLAMKIIEGEAI